MAGIIYAYNRTGSSRTDNKPIKQWNAYNYLSRFHFIPKADRLQTSLAWTSNIARCSHVVYSINLYWDMEHYYPNFYRQWLLSFLFFHDATFL